ncbi:MAG: hypothetical protein ACRC3Y_11945 [Romboutsia sp.]|uniref:hypothetical protein n=1 Tax=Romboutsia sp. TaxID=1965302 RepID=UPI003F2FA852
MILYMALRNKGENGIIYNFGVDKKCLDGKFKIDLKDLNKSKIIKSSDLIGDRMAMKGLIKLIKNIKDNDIKDFECFQS